MKRITGLMKNICTMKNALNAYQKARRCKRYRPEVLEFEANREEYLGKAIRELESLTYTPGKYKVFKVWEPKERIIMALPFYDRVIQHMIVNYIEPIFEHQFIYHSYACRKGKGAHRASKQLTRWLYNLEVEIIKKQEEIIEQCRISDELHKELDDMKNDVDQKMDLIEYDLRSYRREREE